MILDHMTWPEIDAIDRDGTVAVGCIAATEQHSHHLPLATDHIIGSAILQRLHEAAADRVLVLPTVWLGVSSAHMGFAGSLTTSPRHLIDTACDLGESVLRHGFKKVLFVNSHDDNQPALTVAVQDLADRHEGATIVAANYWTIAARDLNDLRESPPGGIGHAGELETSIVLAIAPDLVHMDRAEPDGSQPASSFSQGEMLLPPKVTVPRPFSAFTTHGGFGDPTLATAEKGERFLDAIVRRLAALCEDIAAGRV